MIFLNYKYLMRGNFATFQCSYSVFPKHGSIDAVFCEWLEFAVEFLRPRIHTFLYDIAFPKEIVR